jgi:hypothetical protein
MSSPDPKTSRDVVVGRDVLCARILKSSLDSRVVLVFGGRQAGKTATLRRTAQLNPVKADINVLEDLDLPVYVDLMRLPYDAKPPEFFRMVTELARRHCKDHITGFPDVSLESTSGSATSEVFAADIAKLCVAAKEVKVRFIFLLDEAKRILGSRFPRGFQDNLYALLFDPDMGVGENISLVLSGAQHLYQLFDDDTSPLGSRAISYVVPNLEREDVLELCRHTVLSANDPQLQVIADWSFEAFSGQAGLTSASVRQVARAISDTKLPNLQSILEVMKGNHLSLMRNWIASFSDEARTVCPEFSARGRMTLKEIALVLTERKFESFAADRVAEELIFTGAAIDDRASHLVKANRFFWDYADKYGQQENGTHDERTVWNLIEEAEVGLRALIFDSYEKQWPGVALQRMEAHLGADAWKKICELKARSATQYRRSPGYQGRDEMSCMYFGQLVTLMVHKNAWPMFQGLFRDKRELEDLGANISPVRNDRAHFSKVPKKELDRCRIACDDVTVALTRAPSQVQASQGTP